MRDVFRFPSLRICWKGDPMMKLFSRLFRDEEAATAVEYAVMLALILGTIVGIIGTVGAQSGGLWGGITSDLQAAGL